MRKITPRERSCYCIRVRRAANALTKFYDKALEPAGLTASQHSLLSDIRSLSACNVSELAIHANLDRTTIIRNLSTLRERGFVTEAPGDDRRSKVIKLTEVGEAALVEGKILWQRAQDEVAATIGAESVEQLMQTLKKVESLA